MKKDNIEIMLEKIKKWFDTNDHKLVFLVTLITGLIVHFELYSNSLLAYDGYWHYGSFLAKGWEASLGRPLIFFSDIFRNTIVGSTLTTFISLVITSFSAVILNDLLEIKKKYIKVLIGILLVVTPTLSLTLMYAYTANAYSYAMLFAILSVYFLSKESNKKNTILAIINIIISLSFYQSYLSLITILILIVNIFRLMNNKKYSIKELFKDIGILFIGIVIYYVCLTIGLKILNLNINNYGGGSSILSLATIKNFLIAIKNTYVVFYNFYFSNTIVNNTNWYRHIIYLVMFILININLIIIIKNKKIYKDKNRMISLILMLITYPIFTSSIALIAQNHEVNLLMSSSFYLIIIFMLKELDLFNIDNKLRISSLVTILIIIWTFILSNNATYIATYLFNKQMDALGNRIIMKLEENPEINNDTEIVILGKFNFTVANKHLLDLTNFDVSNINIWTWQIYLEDKLGMERTIFKNKEYTDMFYNDEYINMPIFPNDGSIRIINNIAVVKLSY